MCETLSHGIQCLDITGLNLFDFNAAFEYDVKFKVLHIYFLFLNIAKFQ